MAAEVTAMVIVVSVMELWFGVYYYSVFVRWLSKVYLINQTPGDVGTCTTHGRAYCSLLTSEFSPLKFVHSLSIRISQLDQRDRPYALFGFGCSARITYSMDVSGLRDSPISRILRGETCYYLYRFWTKTDRLPIPNFLSLNPFILVQRYR